jgi:hypothetical protein
MYKRVKRMATVFLSLLFDFLMAYLFLFFFDVFISSSTNNGMVVVRCSFIYSHGLPERDVILGTEALDSFCVKMGCSSAPGPSMFEVDFTKDALTPEQKAIMIGEVLHLDYLFFENEEPPMTIEDWSTCPCCPCCPCCKSPDTLYCLLCNFYCCGALYPCRCILCKEESESLEDVMNDMAGKLEERVAGQT